MLLLCVAFALLTVGLVVPCAIDVAMTPRRYFDLPSKQTWLIVVIAFWAFGAAVWLLVGRREAQMRRLWDDMTSSWTLGAEQSRRPSQSWANGTDYPFASMRRGRQAAMAPALFIAPDDNPDFLLELDRRIRGWREDA